MSERIGVGLVGAGRWGKRVARAAGRTSNLELVSCYTRTEASRGETAAETGCEAAATLEELVADPRVQGVLVLTPNDSHLQVALAAAERGKHLFVEKPIADNLDSALAIGEACSRAKVVLFVAHCFRRLGAARAVGELVSSGRLGRVVLAEARFSLPGSFTPGSWRADPERLVGGPLIQLGVHHCDTLQGWFGPARRVRGSLDHLVADAGVDDVAVALIEHASGTRSVVLCSYVSPKSYGFRLYGTQANLDCTTSMAMWPEAHRMDSQTRITVEGRDGTSEAIPFEPRDMVVDELEEFGRCIREGTTPETGASEGIAALRVVLAAVESARNGRAVELEGPA